jgi:hypothetical protein
MTGGVVATASKRPRVALQGLHAGRPVRNNRLLVRRPKGEKVIRIARRGMFAWAHGGQRRPLKKFVCIGATFVTWASTLNPCRMRARPATTKSFRKSLTRGVLVWFTRILPAIRSLPSFLAQGFSSSLAPACYARLLRRGVVAACGG